MTRLGMNSAARKLANKQFTAVYNIKSHSYMNKMKIKIHLRGASEERYIYWTCRLLNVPFIPPSKQWMEKLKNDS
jgi:hypothetical protein